MLNVLVGDKLLCLLEYLLAAEERGKLLQCRGYGVIAECIEHIIERREVLVLNELADTLLFLVGSFKASYELLEYADMSYLERELHAECLEGINGCGDNFEVSHFELRADKLDACLYYLVTSALESGLGAVNCLIIAKLQREHGVAETCCDNSCDRHCRIRTHYEQSALAVGELVEVLLREIAGIEVEHVKEFKSGSYHLAVSPALEYLEKCFLDVSSYDTLAEEQVFRALGGNKIIIFHNVLHECLFTLVC